MGMFARAWESDAHAIVFDMEDAVPPAQKADARDATPDIASATRAEQSAPPRNRAPSVRIAN